MAFTSRDESVAIIGLGLPWMASLPVADGTFHEIDSAILVYAYRPFVTPYADAVLGTVASTYATLGVAEADG